MLVCFNTCAYIRFSTSMNEWVCKNSIPAIIIRLNPPPPPRSPDTWHLAPDTWHLAQGRGHHSDHERGLETSIPPTHSNLAEIRSSNSSFSSVFCNGMIEKIIGCRWKITFNYSIPMMEFTIAMIFFLRGKEGLLFDCNCSPYFCNSRLNLLHTKN